MENKRIRGNKMVLTIEVLKENYDKLSKMNSDKRECIIMI